MVRLVIVLAWTLLSLVQAAPTQRGNGKVKADAKVEAERATVLFNLGRFEESLRGYERAYELFQAPGLLFNLGQCHRQLAQHERAVFFYSGYMRERPNAPNRAAVEELLRQERSAMAQNRASDPEPSSAPIAIGRAPNTLGSGDRNVAMTPLVDQPAPPVTTRWWFWTAIGGGVLAIATGITLGVVLSNGSTAVGSQASLGILDRTR